MSLETKKKLCSMLPIPKCAECNKGLVFTDEDVDRLIQISKKPEFKGSVGKSGLTIECASCHALNVVELKPLRKESNLYVNVKELLKNPDRVQIRVESRGRLAWDLKLTSNPSSLSDEQLRISLKYHSSRNTDESTWLFAKAQQELFRREFLKPRERQSIPKPKESIFQRIKGALP